MNAIEILAVGGWAIAAIACYAFRLAIGEARRGNARADAVDAAAKEDRRVAAEVQAELIAEANYWRGLVQWKQGAPRPLADARRTRRDVGSDRRREAVVLVAAVGGHLARRPVSALLGVGGCADSFDGWTLTMAYWYGPTPCPTCGHTKVASLYPLTAKQTAVLTFIADYSEQHFYAPTFREIADRFGLRSIATVHEHLSNLVEKGYLERTYNEARSIALTPEALASRNAQLKVPSISPSDDGGRE